MKIGIALKSNFAFERLNVEFLQYDELREVERYTKNIQTIDDLDDAIEFFKLDVVVLDMKLNQINDMSGYAKEKNVHVIYFKTDAASVMQEVIDFFNLGEQEDVPEKKEIDYVSRKKQTEIVYKDRVVEKEVIKTSYTSIPSKLIVVASMWPGAGSTTLAVNLARAIASRGVSVAYVEHPASKPYLFDYLKIPGKESQREISYEDFFRKINEKKIVRTKEAVWNEYGIDWYVPDTRLKPISGFSYEDMIRLSYSVNSTITIVDISSELKNEDVQKFLHHADEIYLCVEPDIVKIDWLATIHENGQEVKEQREEKQVIDYLNKIESLEGIVYQYVNMKYTKKIDNKTWLQCLEKKPLAFVPVIPYEDCLSSVWDSKFLYDSETYHQSIEKAIKPLLVRILPRQFVEKKDGNKGTIKNLLSKFKKGENQ